MRNFDNLMDRAIRATKNGLNHPVVIAGKDLLELLRLYARVDNAIAGCCPENPKTHCHTGEHLIDECPGDHGK